MLRILSLVTLCVVPRTELETRCFCSDLVFQNLSWAHTGSCVLDLLQFVFTTISPEVTKTIVNSLTFNKLQSEINNSFIAITHKYCICLFQVRQNFLADFVCSVYYDNFVKTVITLDQGLSIFR